MSTELMSYQDSFEWLRDVSKALPPPHLLLGNGFSIGYDSDRFNYDALLGRALADGNVGPLALRVFSELKTTDFETVIRSLDSAAIALDALDASRFGLEIEQVKKAADEVRDALAHVLANLHPERPWEIAEECYLRVRQFLDQYKCIYTTNYDLLLYWSLMQDIDADGVEARVSDDGFRDPGHEAPYVRWDYLSPHGQTVHYLHGALHLFRSDSELRKITWVRTGDALIDQIRANLRAGYYPLYVAEGTVGQKLKKISTSDYLAKSLRSLAAIGNGLTIYGLSLHENDGHILEAIAKSRVKRLAVGLFGEVDLPSNSATVLAANRLVADRASLTGRNDLQVKFYDSSTIRLWH